MTVLVCARGHAHKRRRMQARSHDRSRRGTNIRRILFRRHLRRIRRHGPRNVISTSNYMTPGIHVHIMRRVHPTKVHPAGWSTQRPLLHLVLVSKLDPYGLVHSLQLQLTVECLDGTLSSLTLPKLDKGTAVLGRIMRLLLNDINVGNISVRRKNFTDEAFIHIPWQLSNK